MDMKVGLVLVFCFGTCLSEQCTGDDTTTCANMECATGYVPTCITNICTCSTPPDPTACTVLADCNSYWSSHHCNWHHRQCQNGHCNCAHGHGHGR